MIVGNCNCIDLIGGQIFVVGIEVSLLLIELETFGEVLSLVFGSVVITLYHLHRFLWMVLIAETRLKYFILTTTFLIIFIILSVNLFLRIQRL